MWCFVVFLLMHLSRSESSSCSRLTISDQPCQTCNIKEYGVSSFFTESVFEFHPSPSDEAALILIRHGKSLWNEKNLFTGCVDVPLTNKGVEEAIEAGAHHLAQ
ncbi:hypothetical protein Droror1_Dr00001930 [Drosera rotundifolia]